MDANSNDKELLISLSQLVLRLADQTVLLMENCLVPTLQRDRVLGSNKVLMPFVKPHCKFGQSLGKRPNLGRGHRVSSSSHKLSSGINGARLCDQQTRE